MALPGPHHRFISRLRKLQESNLPPLPTRKMAADFRRQTNAHLAALRQMVPRDAIGRQPRQQRQQQRPRGRRAGDGPAPDTPASQDGLPKTDAASRIAAILERPAQELDVSEVWRMATDPPEPASRAEAEDDAISRLLRGIEQHSSKVWRDSSPVDYNTLSAASYSQQTVEREEDDGVHLVRLHNRIHVASVRHDLDNLRGRLQLIADTVEFGLLWLSLGGDRGGRCPAKSEFYKNVYFSQNPDAYVTQLDKQDIELNPDFVHWKESVMRPIVTGRNRLVQLYKKFGLPLLLDPFWSVKGLHPNSRTREFTEIFRQLLQIAHSRDYDDAAVAFLKGFDMRVVAERLFDVENGEVDSPFPIDTSSQ